MRQSSKTSNTLWACVIWGGGGGGGITVQRYFAFESTVGLWTLYIQELRYTNTFCECILKKIGPTHAHFQYNARKQEPINVVKVRFSMRYFSIPVGDLGKKVHACSLRFSVLKPCSGAHYSQGQIRECAPFRETPTEQRILRVIRI